MIFTHLLLDHFCDQNVTEALFYYFTILTKINVILHAFKNQSKDNLLTSKFVRHFVNESMLIKSKYNFPNEDSKCTYANLLFSEMRVKTMSFFFFFNVVLFLFKHLFPLFYSFV